MGEFTLRDKLESWIEGILDIVEVYFQTMYYLHLKPRESVKYLDPYRKKGFYYSEEYDKVGTKVKFSRPGFYMILSYFFMLFLIKDIDFTETLPTFFLNFVDILGAINAAKSMRVEEINALWIIHKVYFAFTLIVHTCPQTGEKQTNASSEEENSY